MKYGYERTDKLNLTYIKEVLYDELITYNKIMYNKQSLENKIFKLNDLYYKVLRNIQNYTDEEYSSLCLELRTKIENTEKEYHSLEFNIDTITKDEYLSLIEDLKRDDYITKDQYGILIDLFKRKGFESKKIVQLLECVKVHNIITHLNSEKKDVINYRNIYKVIDMLDLGYEQIPDIKVNENIKNQLDKMVKDVVLNHRNEIIYKTDELVSNIVNLYENSYLSLDEYKYVLFNIMRETREDLFNITKEVCDLNNYNDKIIRYKLVSKYKFNLIFYNKIRNMVDCEIDKINHNKLEKK